MSVRPKAIWPEPTASGDLLVAREDLHAVGLQVAEELLGLLVAPGGEQAGRMSGRRAEERLGDADLPLPFRVEQVLDSLGPVGLGDELGVDDQDAGPGREAVPRAVLGLERLGQVARRGRGWNGASKPRSLSRSVFRISLFQNRSQRGRRASAMIRFVRPTVLVLSTSNLGRTVTSSPLAVGFQHRLGELAVEGRVDDDRVGRARWRPTPRTQHSQGRTRGQSR